MGMHKNIKNYVDKISDNKLGESLDNLMNKNQYIHKINNYLSNHIEKRAIEDYGNENHYFLVCLYILGYIYLKLILLTIYLTVFIIKKVFSALIFGAMGAVILFLSFIIFLRDLLSGKKSSNLSQRSYNNSKDNSKGNSKDDAKDNSNVIPKTL